MKTLREKLSEVVGVMRQQVLTEIGDELRARFDAMYALTGKLKWDDGRDVFDSTGIYYDRERDVITQEPRPPSGVDIFGRSVQFPRNGFDMFGRRVDCGKPKPSVKHIKTEWVKTAISRLVGFHPGGFSYSKILGECRRGRRNVSEAHLAPILGRMKKSGLLESPSKGFYRATYKSVATKE